MEKVNQENKRDFEMVLKEANQRVKNKGFKMWDEVNLTIEKLKEEYEEPNFYVGYIKYKKAFSAIITLKDTYFWNGFPNDAVYLHKFAISNEFCGLGLSDVFLSEIIAEAKKYEVKKIRLDVRKDAINLRKMYERNGFLLICEKEFYYGCGALYERNLS